MGGKIPRSKDKTLNSELVSPSERFFLQRGLDVSIDSFISFQSPVDVAAVKAALKSSPISHCPRLRSLLVADDNERLRWIEQPEIDIDNHVIIVPEEEDEVEEKENDTYINEYLAALPSLAPLTRKIPLWEVHVLPIRRRSLVLRFHHALSDCVSLLGLLLASCDPAEDIPIAGKKRERPLFSARVVNGGAVLWRTLKAARRTLPEVRDYCMLGIRRNEDMTVLASGKDLDRSPRKLASLVLCLEDMKEVKNKLNAKINDVFVGAISLGIAKYLEFKSSNETSEDIAIKGLVVVNIRGEGSKDVCISIKQGREIKWGNRFGYFVLPIRLKRKSNDPLDYVREAKAILDLKKKSLVAQYTYKINALMVSLLGQKATAEISYKFRHNISLVLSNMVGPSEPITFASNLITKMGVTLSSLPAALDVHMMSYNGKAFLQFLVAEEVIPDPELLCMFVQEALRDMKDKL